MSIKLLCAAHNDCQDSFAVHHFCNLMRFPHGKCRYIICLLMFFQFLDRDIRTLHRLPEPIQSITCHRF